jgi:uncharacterized damage-inducible protein DinB
VEARLAPLYAIFKLNSSLFLNTLVDMDDDQASWRPTEQTNSAAYLALHLVDTRYFMATHIGLTLVNPFAALLKEARSIRDLRTLPRLDEVRAAWKAVTGETRVKFGQMTDAHLNVIASAKLPTDDETTLGMLSFLMQHESYHIGQLGLLRKQMGLPAMLYR